MKTTTKLEAIRQVQQLLADNADPTNTLEGSLNKDRVRAIGYLLECTVRTLTPTERRLWRENRTPDLEGKKR